ncbi:hypothetical protein GCM10010145_14910 [Streptomyces ruber]|uniref:Uncharacterized protein n=2 Tax=Streptomyces TaxID=1883 RepID=A0A918ERJ4_9ACTN|nr:hypothetical protein GCM10010145_14910 [Streptomyces ruber]
MQNTRRALQPHRNDSTKGARIIVPVFLPPGKDRPTRSPPPPTAPSSPSSRGLRSHDETRRAARLPRPHQRTAHDPRPTRRRRRIIGAGTGGKDDGEDQEHYDADAAAESALLHFSTPRDPATIAALLRTRVHRPGSLIWPQG